MAAVRFNCVHSASVFALIEQNVCPRVVQTTTVFRLQKSPLLRHNINVDRQSSERSFVYPKSRHRGATMSSPPKLFPFVPASLVCRRLRPRKLSRLLRGTVTDPNGAVFQTLRLTSSIETTGETRTKQPRVSSGRVYFAALLPGLYLLRIAMPASGSQLSARIVAYVNQEVRVELPSYKAPQLLLTHMAFSSPPNSKLEPPEK